MHIQININDLILECEYIPLEDSSSPYEVNNKELSQKNENIDNADIKFIKFEAFDLEILPEVCLQGLEEKTVNSANLLLINILKNYRIYFLFNSLDIFTRIT